MAAGACCCRCGAARRGVEGACIFNIGRTLRLVIEKLVAWFRGPRASGLTCIWLGYDMLPGWARYPAVMLSPTHATWTGREGAAPTAAAEASTAATRSGMARGLGGTLFQCLPRRRRSAHGRPRPLRLRRELMRELNYITSPSPFLESWPHYVKTTFYYYYSTTTII